MTRIHVYLVLNFCFVPQVYAEPKKPGGMVCADHPLAAKAGAKMLALGGDAADAAIATAFTLGVVNPFASGIGGGGFALIHRNSTSSQYSLDFREVASRGASRNMFLDKRGNVIPNASRRGPRAAGVPGEVAGLHTLHVRHGKLPWKTLLQPAIRAAREGFKCGDFLHKKIVEYTKELASHPSLASRFLTSDKKPMQIGSIIKQPKLAKSLEAIAQGGASVFYRGDLARQIAHGVRRAGGLISELDLKTYTVKERKPMVAQAMGLTILSMAPPSSGGSVLIQVLRVLDGVKLKTLGHNSSAYIHRVVETLKHGFADRARFMGDPDFTPIPTDEMLSDGRRDEIRQAFEAKRTLTNKDYGGRYSIPEDGGTSHISVMDQWGNAVALTTTINTSFGSFFIPGDTGILLNNQMDDFVAQPGVPNAFGLIGREANAIVSGKRPLSSMSPTIILKNGVPVIALGASGGPTIITGTLQVLLNILVFGQSAQQAVTAPRFHHQWQPDSLFLEPEISTLVKAELRRKGHDVRYRKRFSAVQVILREDGILDGGADPSKMGSAVPAAPSEQRH